MLARIVEWLKGVLSIDDAFSRMQQFFRTAPRPLDRILSYASWVFLLSLVAMPVIATTTLASHLGLNSMDLTIRSFVEKLRNGVEDFVAYPFTRIARVYDVVVDNWPSPKLQPVGALGDAPTFQWEIQDSLVVATEATAQGVQHFLKLCDMSKASQLQLTATLADEFADFARFLHLLRDSPAAAALNLQAPRSGFESRWKAVLYRLDVAYRTVWCRWIRRQPGSTVKNRKDRLVGLFNGSFDRRKTWRSNFKNLSFSIKEKRNLSCDDSDDSDGIEGAARQLGPASMSSFLFNDLSVHVHGAQAGTWSRVPSRVPKGTSAEEQAELDRKARATKALIEQHERCFELQTLAARCMTRCALLNEHINALGDILAWLNARSRGGRSSKEAMFAT